MIINDLEKFTELYESVDVEWDLRDDDHEDNEGGKIIHLEVGKHHKVDGYVAMFTEIVFDKNGKFIKQNIWE